MRRRQGKFTRAPTSSVTAWARPRRLPPSDSPGLERARPNSLPGQITCYFKAHKIYRNHLQGENKG